MSMNPWLPYRKKRSGAKLRLFCFPHAGAGASSFRGWSDVLPLDVELCALQYPGRETRFADPILENVPDLAAAIADAIAPELNKPFAFFGHSMGALAAYETARLLRTRGGPQPRRVILSGRGAAHLPLPRPAAHALPEPELLAALRRYSNRTDELLAHPDLLAIFIPILRADLGAVENYRPGAIEPLLAPITCLGGLGDVDVPWYRLDAWRMHTLGGFRVWMLPGGHFFLHPPSKTLTDLLAADLSNTRLAESALRPGEVQVWKIRLDQPDEEITRLTEILSPEERERARRMYRPAVRRQFLVSQAALRSILGRVLGQAPQRLQFGASSHGKPFLQGDDLSFNLAHSGDMALVALTREGPIGIDVERVRADLDWTTMSRHTLSDEERSALSELPPDYRLTGFFTFWTRKEASLKAAGLVSDAATPGSLATSPDPLPQSGEPKDGRTQADLCPEPGYIGSLVVQGSCTHFRMESWSPELLAPSTRPGS
jgi:medium-chain acyl-[acyl-carrier-protein] hydrolase